VQCAHPGRQAPHCLIQFALQLAPFLNGCAIQTIVERRCLVELSSSIIGGHDRPCESVEEPCLTVGEHT
jgi:hypothetical protein